MLAGIVTEAAAGRGPQRKVDELLLELTGLVHVRALLEARGVSAAEVSKFEDEISRVRAELARASAADATTLAAAA